MRYALGGNDSRADKYMIVEPPRKLSRRIAMIKLELALRALCDQVIELADVVENLEHVEDADSSTPRRAQQIATAIRTIALQMDDGIEIGPGDF
jgi:hypothetical protein